MNNTQHAQRLFLASAITGVTLAAACAGDTVYLPSAEEVREQEQQSDGESDAGASDGAVEARAPVNVPDTATYCRVVDPEAAWQDIQFACDLDAPLLVLEFPDCPCTAAYGCGVNADAGVGDASMADTEPPSFVRVTSFKTCKLDYTDENGSSISCDSYELALTSCTDVASCAEVPESAIQSLRDDQVPAGVCSVKRTDASLRLDTQGYQAGHG